MRIDKKVIEKVFISPTEREKILEVIQIFDEIYQTAVTNELPKDAATISEKINEFLDNYCI